MAMTPKIQETGRSLRSEAARRLISFGGTEMNHNFKYNVSATLKLVAMSSVLTPMSAFAHGGHTKQPPGIIDPLITHHAILEDELKLNYFGSRFEKTGFSAHTGSLELAYAFTDLLGVEVFVPFGITSRAGVVGGGIGDLELLLPKISFLRRQGFVMTTYVATRIPTGDEASGLGEPTWTFAPHVLMDIGIDNLGIQSNAAVEFETDGAITWQGNLSLAYSFVLNEQDGVLLSPLVEASVEAPVRGEKAGKALAALTPGLKFAWNGWHLGAGVNLPVTTARESDFLVMVQVGYHVRWEKLFSVSAAAPHPR